MRRDDDTVETLQLGACDLDVDAVCLAPYLLHGGPGHELALETREHQVDVGVAAADHVLPLWAIIRCQQAVVVEEA